MGSLLLNTQTVIMCPHGGIVTHIPLTYTSYRVDGRPPMLLTDQYLISGCPFFSFMASPCFRVLWISGSVNLIIRGVPALTLSSVGLCQSASGIMQGPVIMTYTQTGQREPDEFTSVSE